MRNLSIYEINDILSQDFIIKDIYTLLINLNIKIIDENISSVIICDNYNTYLNINKIKSLYYINDNIEISTTFAFFTYLYYTGFINDIESYTIDISEINTDIIKEIVYEFYLPENEMYKLFNIYKYHIYNVTNVYRRIYKGFKYNILSNSEDINNTHNTTIDFFINEIILNKYINMNNKFVKYRLDELTEL